MQAVVITVIGAFVVGMLATDALQGVRTSQSGADRAAALPIADSAITKYLFELQSDMVTEGTDYVLNQEAMDSIASSTPNSTVIPNATLPGDATLRTVQGSVANYGGAFTMREKSVSSQAGQPQMYGYWQLYHVIRPDDYAVAGAKATDDHSLIAYFRSWTGDASNANVTKPRIVRAQFRPGFFSDYQLITDAPIQYGAGASVSGPVHTNGYQIGSTALQAGIAVDVAAGGSLTCQGGASITAAKGSIGSSVPNSCITAPSGRNPTGKVIDFLQAEESFTSIMRDGDSSGPRRTFVFPYDGTPSTVTLAGSAVQVDGRAVANINGRRPLALLFQGDVAVQGTISGRLTIAAQSFNEPGYPTPPAGAADIYLLNDTGIPTSGSGTNVQPTNRGKDALGLIAEGNVYVPTKNSNGTCASMLSAAIIAVSGRVSLPVNETTQIEQTGFRPCQNLLTVYGSMASHMAPILQWKWGAGGGSTGYTQRTYSYNPFLKESPPPYFPRSSVWRVAGWKDANYDCLTNASTLTDRNCR